MVTYRSVHVLFTFIAVWVNVSKPMVREALGGRCVIRPARIIIKHLFIIIYSSFAPHGACGFDSASPSEAPVSVSWVH
jgi:hypothetical protein